MREERNAGVTGGVGLHSEGVTRLNVSNGDEQNKADAGDVVLVQGGIMSWASGREPEQKRFSADVGVDVMNNVRSGFASVADFVAFSSVPS